MIQKDCQDVKRRDVKIDVFRKHDESRRLKRGLINFQDKEKDGQRDNKSHVTCKV